MFGTDRCGAVCSPAELSRYDMLTSARRRISALSRQRKKNMNNKKLQRQSEKEGEVTETHYATARMLWA